MRERIWLLVTAGVGGAAVMVCEVLGARMLSPFFGMGLYAWSALISVTLTALAAGYFAGGVAARRDVGRRGYYRLVILAAVLLAVTPLLLEPVLRLSEDLDLRLGALLSASLLFGPSLVVMGMLSPIAVDLVAREGTAAGGAAGRIFAISTICGLVATLLVGFVFVPHFRVSSTMTGAATALLGAGVIGGALTRRADAALAIALPIPWIFGAPPQSDAPLDGVRILERASSLYGELAVVEDTNRASTLRLLRADQSFVGAQWVEGREPAFGFVHVLEAVRLANPEGHDLLLIGLGIGSLSMELADDGIRTDVVEIDPEIVRLAETHFAYVPTGAVHVQDARTFIRRTSSRYDFIVHDTFTGGSTPEHLLSSEFIREVRERLRPGGILAVNLVGASEGPLSPHAASVVATLESVFAHVRAFRDAAREDDPEAIHNLALFAADAPIHFADPTLLHRSPACASVLDSFQRWEVTDDLHGHGVVITDDQNPLTQLAVPVSEAFRESMRRLYPREFWLQ